MPVAFLGLSLLIAVAPGGSAGTLQLVLFAVALPTVVVLHRRLLRPKRNGRATAAGSMFRTPFEIALAVIVVVGGGVSAAILLSVLLVVVAAPIVGDGSGLLRLLLVAFVLVLCFSLGRRCGRWWAFAGAAGLLPPLVVAAVVGGSTTSRGIGLVALAVLGTGCALALGSLQADWEARSTMRVRDGGRARPREAARYETAQRRSRSALG